MKKLFSILLITIVLVVSPSLVFAETSSPSGVNRLKEKLGDIKQNVQQKLGSQKENALAKVRKSVEVRYNVFSKAVDRVAKILDRIQIRIDKAKAAGKDVTEMNSLMADARAKLADAKTVLGEIKTLNGTAMDKAGFLAIQAKFKIIKDDLHAARQDAAKIIRTLKGFNSATSSGKNPQSEGTSPGKQAE